jgi:hypothetical protein
MTTSPTLTTHYLAETDPRQHAFPHSPNTSEEEMEEKEHVNQNLHLISNSEQCLFSSEVRPYGLLPPLPPLSPRPKAATCDCHWSPKARISTCWLMCASLVSDFMEPPPAVASTL